MVSGPVLIMSVNDWLVVWDALSDTVIVKLEPPGVVGVPEITPPVLRVSSDGSDEPDASVQV
jgi:hypothetical protein